MRLQCLLQSLALLLSRARCEEAASRCPQGFFRRSAILFRCSGASGTAHHLLAPAATTAVETLPAGLLNFSLEATAEAHIGLKLAKGSEYIVDGTSRELETVTQSRPVGSWRGLPLRFSASQRLQRLELLGELPAEVELRVGNHESFWGDVALNFSYAGLALAGGEPCSGVPLGCDLFDESLAKMEVLAWSRWAQQQFETVDEAWLLLAAPQADSAGGVRWHSWPAVWSRSGLGVQAFRETDWQAAFHYLDADGDGVVGEGEFERAYDATAWLSTTRQSRTETTSSGSETTSTTSSSTTLLAAATYRGSWAEQNRWWLLGCFLLTVLAVGLPILLSRRKRPRTRGVRGVMSRESDGRLEISDSSRESYRGSREDYRGSREDYCGSHEDYCEETDTAAPPFFAEELAEQTKAAPRPPFFGLLPYRPAPPEPRMAFGGVFSPSFRYGPVATVEDTALRPVDTALRPVAPYPLQAVQRLPSSPLARTRELNSALEPPSSLSLSVAATGTSFGPLRVIQASPEQLESLKAAPKVHVAERATSFATSQANGSFSVLEQVSLQDAPKATSFAASLSNSQTPWAAVFTPEEWERATQLANQTQLPQTA